MKDGIMGLDKVLCIGLDFAWFGGSKNKKKTQYDVLSSIVLNGNPKLTIKRVQLCKNNRDINATKITDELSCLLNKCEDTRVILSVDAPLQANKRCLPIRTGIPMKGGVQRRSCENILNRYIRYYSRKKEFKKWKPNIQPGAPLAPRVKKFINIMENKGFSLWGPNNNGDRILLESFPAEAIWATKVIGGYKNVEFNSVMKYKRYKKMKIKMVSRCMLIRIINNVLESFSISTGYSEWSAIKKQVSRFLVEDSIDGWKRGNNYIMSKYLDDVIDSVICLAVAISYHLKKYHVFYCKKDPLDGHIIGPGFCKGFMETF